MITAYWYNLNDRERWMAIIGSACILFYLFYLLIYSPLSTAVETKRNQLRENKETLAWMEHAKQQPKQQKTAQIITNAKLLALIGNQLTNNNLRKFPYQLQQTASGDIQLSYDQVPYNQFLLWLWSLSTDYAITIKQFSAERSNSAGIVKIMIVIAAR